MLKDVVVAGENLLAVIMAAPKALQKTHYYDIISLNLL